MFPPVFRPTGEPGATLYTTIFPGAKLGSVSRFGAGGPRPAGMVITAELEIRGPVTRWP
jgi:two-component system sensor histidine kinase QseC